MTTEVGIKLLESVKGSKMQYYGAAVLGCLCAGKDLKTRGLKGLFADIRGGGGLPGAVTCSGIWFAFDAFYFYQSLRAYGQFYYSRRGPKWSRL